MSGVTAAGFVTKRFPEILESLREQATPLFQDLVAPGDIVDTSDSTVLGRLIGLTTPSLAELWEAAQEVYSSFDPNQASGIALDNLVAIGGLVRNSANPTTFSGLAWGEAFTEIPSGALVRGTTSTMQYQATSAVTLDTTDVVGAGFEITDTTVGNAYSISLASYSGIVSLTTTAVSGDTAGAILARLKTQLAVYPNYTSTLEDDTLSIKIVDHYGSFNASLSGAVAWMKSAKRVEFSAVENGRNEVAINTVNIISTPVLGWESINNPIPAIVGSELESDTELRERFRQSKYLRASNTADALYSALLELDGAQEIRLYVNDTDLVDAIGLPAHSFLVLMLGGSDTDIAQTIWKHTPLGIASQGAQQVAIRTSQGLEQVVKFDRPTYVPLYAEIDLTTDSGFPSGGEDTIKKALSDYITQNQTIGGKVVYSRLFGPVNETPGHEIVTLKIGLTAGTVAETTLAMAYNQIAVLPVENITII